MAVSHAGWLRSLSWGLTSTTRQQEERKKGLLPTSHKENSWRCSYLYDLSSISHICGGSLPAAYGCTTAFGKSPRREARGRGEKKNATTSEAACHTRIPVDTYPDLLATENTLPPTVFRVLYFFTEHGAFRPHTLHHATVPAAVRWKLARLKRAPPLVDRQVLMSASEADKQRM